jgi:hypothetical protein
MTIGFLAFLPMHTDAKPNLPEVNRECHDHEFDDAHGGSPQTLRKASVQPNHHEIHHAHHHPKLLIGRIKIFWVVHDHTRSHDVPHDLCAPCSTRVLNNSPPILENTICPLHILPTSLLLLCKPILFLLCKIVDCLHKCGQSG